MGFGETLKEQNFFVNQRKVRQTRKQHQRDQCSKEISVETRFYLTEPSNSRISIFPFTYYASAGNSRRAKTKHLVLLSSGIENIYTTKFRHNLLFLDSNTVKTNLLFHIRNKNKPIAILAIKLKGKGKKLTSLKVKPPIKLYNNTKNENTSVFIKRKLIIYFLYKLIFINFKNYKLKNPELTLMNQEKKEELLLALVSKKDKNGEIPILYKLSGVTSKSIKVVHNALTGYCGFNSKEIGGLNYFPELTTWVFLAFPSKIFKGIESLKDNKYGIQISGFTNQEIGQSFAQLIVYAYNISKNKKEQPIIKKAAKKLLDSLNSQDEKEIKSIIFIIPNMNKPSSNYSYKFINFFINQHKFLTRWDKPGILC